MGDEDVVPVSVAMRILGVSSRTLRRYTQEGLLPDRRSPGGHRVFVVRELRALGLRRAPGGGPAGEVVLYARVSSRRQQREGDLERQLDRLRVTAGGRAVAGAFTDVASGLSERRRGLQQALAACQRPEAAVLLVEHPERVARFGTHLLSEVVLPSWGVTLEVAEPGGDLSVGGADAELVRDMLAVVTSFSGRLYGQRSARQRAIGAAPRRQTDREPAWRSDPLTRSSAD